MLPFPDECIPALVSDDLRQKVDVDHRTLIQEHLDFPDFITYDSP